MGISALVNLNKGMYKLELGKIIRNKQCWILALMLFFANVSFAQVNDKEKKTRKGIAWSVKLDKSGTLNKRIPEKLIPAIRVLKVSGRLSNQDVEFIKQLAHRKTLKDTLGNILEPYFDLDLSNATIMMTNSFSKSGVSDIPDGFLKGSKLLRRILLPMNTEKIGRYAFQGCVQIKEIKLPMGTKSVGAYSFSG